jgi:phenylalanyl-tRNA synthetase beta chain
VRLPLSWLREHVDMPAGAGPREVTAGLVRLGLEVDAVHHVGDDLTGPIVIGRVVSYEEFTASNGKTVRWCQVDVGEPEPRGIVCGARNFAEDDRVVVALPGSVLPGGFVIRARKAYGHVSDGMICSARELGLGDEHTGILVLPDDAPVGADAVELLELRDVVLDLEVSTDRGYELSVRGITRELSHAFDAPFHDPADLSVPDPDDAGWPVRIDDPAGCDRFSARTVLGLDPQAPTPLWLRRRLVLSGIRSISLPVDVTNYVMLETGQPMHAFDRAKLSGPLVVRRARPGEHLVTLDGVDRTLDPDDLLVADDSGPIALAGIMGGASTEIGPGTTDVILEAAHWDPATISRGVRRHKLPSEAAKRFERDVDPEVAGPALQRACDLLTRYGGADTRHGATVVGPGPRRVTITLPVGLPARVAGMPIPAGTVVHRLEQVGCTVAGSEDMLGVIPPSWRPDLLAPADLVEEVVRLEGYEKIPSTLPSPPPGRGLTERQRARRSVGRALAEAGFAEVLSYPFVALDVHDDFGLKADDPRRNALRLANPLSEAEPELRTSLLPGLLATLRRNIGRGLRDLALFEAGLVYLSGDGELPLPVLGVERRPTRAELARLLAGIPDQPTHLAVVLAGARDPAGWWGPARPACWADAVEAARTVAATVRVELTVRSARQAPWHPGRCAALLRDGRTLGYAGELHPRVVAALDLPERTSAMELDLDALGRGGIVRAPALSTYPPALLDVALVVPDEAPAAEVAAALRDGAGPLLESLRLFDLYTDPERLGPGRRSLAYALRFRAPDRTLTVDEASAARDAAVAEAARRTGAVLRT